MELSEAVSQNLFGLAAGLIGGVAGGIVTGIYTLKAADKAISDAENKEVRRDEREVQNLLDALGVEIGTLWNFHMKRVGGLVEALRDGEPLEFFYPLTQDYFTIYNSNAALIGRIKDCDLAEAIVVCYNKCKKVVDGFKYNNDLVKEYHQYSYIPDKTPHDELCAKTKRDDLIAYARVIKEDHFEVKGYVEKLLGLIKSRDVIVKNS